MTTTFLVAEDDAALGRSIARLLRPFGNVQNASTLSEARHEIENNTFDGVVVDVSLPDGSGFDVLRFARHKRPQVQALVLSGIVNSTRLAEALSLHAAYLLKPAESKSIRLFARRALKSDNAMLATLAEWQKDYRLTPSEVDVLRLAALGHERSVLAELRDVATSTIKKQVVSLLRKTLDSSLENAVSRLLRSALELRIDQPSE
jgi:DNA-binding NarL/FixJ family response regulator